METRLSFSRKLLAACTIAMTATAAHAGITVYTNQAAYLQAVSGTATDTFDDLTMTETAGPLLRSLGGYGYQVSAGPSDGGFYPSGSGSDIWLSSTISSDVITFSGFSSSVFGFGGSFFGTDSFGAFMPDRTVVLSAVSGADIETFTLSNASQDSFVAFVSDHPLTSVSFWNMENDGTVYWAAANNVVLAVPEPTTLSMLLGGLGLTALTRRRRGTSRLTKPVA